MRKYFFLSIGVLFLFACKTDKNNTLNHNGDGQFVIAFGSCNKHGVSNLLWDDILDVNPDVWVWGGDIIYADTDDMKIMSGMYDAQNQVEGYKMLRSKVPVVGTWDDHDYGLNDGGAEFHAKKESQQMLLDFLGVAKDDPRRKQEGVYASHDYDLPKGKVKIIILDTRYFRTALTPDTLTKKRNKPNAYGQGTMLGVKQWDWLQDELNTSKADFNLIVSSVQFLSNKHGFECWGNFPHEVDKLKQTIVKAKAKGVMVLSGDRHISEFSKTNIDGLPYPLIDFTSSGLTHVYSDFSGEENPYREGDVVFEKSFGLISIDLPSKEVQFKIMGNQGKMLGETQQFY
jgi:alkaline phosphatase D